MEKTNVRYLEPQQIPDVMDFISIDVAFISLTKVLQPVRNLLKDHCEVVCLIKPQFEAGREKVGKKGVVRDPQVHIDVIEKIIAYAVSIGFRVLNLDYSPIKGPEGNIEYLLHIRKSENLIPEGTEIISIKECTEYIDNENLADLTNSIVKIVSMSHNTLNL
jgi:23S rRNA (cytidine1920-2'-O)/16S rRNA (cytidine1409-2'-O)-methyltransferase